MTPQQKDKSHGTRESAIIVIWMLGTHSLVSLVGTIVLCATGANAAIIAIVAGAGGASTGALSAMLNQTEKQQPGTNIQQADKVESAGPTTVTPSDPQETP